MVAPIIIGHLMLTQKPKLVKLCTSYELTLGGENGCLIKRKLSWAIGWAQC